MIKVGVIGLGAMGQHHVRLYSKLNCELVGVADTDSGRAQEMGEKYNTNFYSDYHQLFGKVDAVSIVVPTTLHHSIATNCLKAGIHCIVEKPIAFKLEEADEMIRLAEENKVNLAVGHIERFNPAVVKLKELIDKGVLGKILIVSTRRVGPYVSRIRDVGVVVDSATHDIGVIRYLLDREPISIFSRVRSLKHEKEDLAIIVLGFDETIANIEVNWFTPQKVRTLVATGSEGIAYLDYISQELKLYSSSSQEDANVIKAEPLKLELENFLKSIEQRIRPAVDGNEGRAILEIALESCKNNHSEKIGNGHNKVDNTNCRHNFVSIKDFTQSIEQLRQ
jgi:UDP-N-acetylglucosamine 3-dehydrogenase